MTRVGPVIVLTGFTDLCLDVKVHPSPSPTPTHHTHLHHPHPHNPSHPPLPLTTPTPPPTPHHPHIIIVFIISDMNSETDPHGICNEVEAVSMTAFLACMMVKPVCRASHPIKTCTSTRSLPGYTHLG